MCGIIGYVGHQQEGDQHSEELIGCRLPVHAEHV